MKIIIAGGTGFIGQSLARYFLASGNEIIVLGRNIQKIKDIYRNQVVALTWDRFNQESLSLLHNADLIINLAGTNIGEKRWSKERKQAIIESRVHTTHTVAESCAKLGEQSPPLFNASAVGIYGQHNKVAQPLTEEAADRFTHNTDFLHQVAQQWEEATLPASNAGVRVVNMRFSLVLDKKGLLGKLKLPFSLGLGGPIGTGDQPLAWIELDDLIAAINFLITQPTIQGPVNFAAPGCISQKQFANAFASILHRPAILKTPAFLIKTLLGQMGEELLLNGQCVDPQVLLSHGFKFTYSDITTALRHIYQ
ncbi:MAG: TIGR01777 family protein [Gammaproteobacteria bacterium]|nr:TIGR01777 family protein [Gammaproteobacteria bacterium]